MVPKISTWTKYQKNVEKNGTQNWQNSDAIIDYKLKLSIFIKKRNFENWTNDDKVMKYARLISKLSPKLHLTFDVRIDKGGWVHKCPRGHR